MSTRAILLVEDTMTDEKLTVRALTESRISNPVVVARDGQQALDYLFCRGAFRDRDIRDLPQLVLLDLKLPKINGLEVLQQIRASPQTHEVPVVILTSSREEEDIMKGYAGGANSYVAKPVEFHAFAEAVRQLGLYWTVLSEPVPERHR